LALAYFNKRNDPQAALTSLEMAFALNTEDARVFFELDQLHKKLGYSPEKRFANLEKHKSLVMKRDDLYLQYVILLNSLGQFEQAIQAISARKFHPWEGGEGKVTGQYVFAHVELGKRALNRGEYERALSFLQKALVYPVNLGEGKLTGAQENNIYYYLGCAYELMNQQDEAKNCFRFASQGLNEPASAMFYNDQPPDMIFYQGMAWLKLQDVKEAKRRFNKLIDYAEKHLFDDVKIDYFAVSLPDFLVFEDDLNKRNEIHCRYMRGLGLIGLNQNEQAAEQMNEVLRQDLNHQGAWVHKQLCV
jgi:tetratricopeptide (TPR) repeat protein